MASPRLDHMLDCSLDLMRRMPPQQVESDLSDLIDIAPELCEDLLSSIDQPLRVARDKITGKDYLLCDYNRDGDSYRSPWSNQYDPPLDDGAVSSDKLRTIEILANQAFDTYREIYYGESDGLSSVYLWDVDNGFAGVILFKKRTDSAGTKGCWDSIHVVEVQEKGRSAHYKITSVIILWLQSIKAASGMMNIAGSILRQLVEDNPISFKNAHVHNIGRMVEKMENEMRKILDKVYFEKTSVNILRSPKRITDS